MNPHPIIYTIDDDESLNILMKAHFRRYACEIHTFTDPLKLYEAVRRQAPNLVLVDLNLSEGHSGFDVIRNLRERHGLPCPILVLSGESQNVQVAHALEVGATDFLVKPPFRAEFEERLVQYIQSANQPVFEKPKFFITPPDRQSVKIEFNLSIEEVSSTGFTLLSTHLIRKGESFWLQGEALKKMGLTIEKIAVTVIGSASTYSENQKLYQLKVEIDGADEKASQELKVFLGKMRIEGSESKI